MLRRLFPALFCLAACEFPPRLTPDVGVLVGNSIIPSKSPDCASCHAYPPPDVHHMFHLFGPNANFHVLDVSNLNGVVTCMDCHFNSVLHFSYIRLDSVWVDVNGNESLVRKNSTDRLARIQTYKRFKPMHSPADDSTLGVALANSLDSLIHKSAETGALLQWMTSRAHNNGKVEVAFPPNAVTDEAALTTAYHPQDFSCSSIACHTVQGLYRWPNPARGLSACPSLLGGDTTCGETSP